MAELHAVSKERHAGKAWRRHDNYRFAEGDALCPLAAVELPKAMMAAPIAFIQHDDAYVPVLVQGFQPDSNLLVSEQGHWRGRYLPQNYRTYPFSLLPNADGELTLCIDEESGVLTESGTPDSYDLFNGQAEPSETTTALLDELRKLHEGLQAARQLSAILDSHGLLKPWQFTVPIGSENQEVKGLFSVDEEKLNQLEAQQFTELRNSRALLLAYCQLFSMTHIQGLVKLLGSAAVADQGELSFGESEEGTLSFDNL